VGQLCTKPGVVVTVGDAQPLIESLKVKFSEVEPGYLLNPRIAQNFSNGITRLEETKGVKLASKGKSDTGRVARATFFTTNADTFLNHDHLSDELFGPTAVIVTCSTVEEAVLVLSSLDGQLTGTIHATDKDLEGAQPVISALQARAGRLIFNGFPTGVDVNCATVHGGPNPATSDGRSSSVGSMAIDRWLRPICFQNAPPAILPAELKNENPRGIWRTVNDQITKEAL
jgi:NADP-dependent aldehyde dehydrogenase